MNTVVLELPFDALALPGMSPEALAREAQFMLALKLFEVGRLSSGKAAKLCGMGRVEFLLAAGRAGVPIAALDNDEVMAEFNLELRTSGYYLADNVIAAACQAVGE